MVLKVPDIANIMKENIILVSGIVLLSLFSIILGLYSNLKSLLIYIIITVFTALLDIKYRYSWLNDNEFGEKHATVVQNKGEDVINPPFSIIVRNFSRVILGLVATISYYTLFIALPIYVIFLLISAKLTVEAKVILIILFASLSIVLIVGLIEDLLHHFKVDMSKFFQWRGVVKDKEPLDLINHSNFLILYSFVLLTLAFWLSFFPSIHNLFSSQSANSSAAFQSFISIFEEFPEGVAVLALLVIPLMYTLLVLMILPLKYNYDQKHILTSCIKKFLKINSYKLSALIESDLFYFLIKIFSFTIIFLVVAFIINLVNKDFFTFLIPNFHLFFISLRYNGEFLVMLMNISSTLILEEFFLFITLSVDSVQVSNGKTQDKNNIKSKIRNFVEILSKLNFVELLSFLIIYFILFGSMLLFADMVIFISLAGLGFSKLYHPLISIDLLVKLSVILILSFAVIIPIIVIIFWPNKLRINSFATFTFLLAQIIYVVSYGIFTYMFLIILNAK